jgi:CheY-like chemotaxis protein
MTIMRNTEDQRGGNLDLSIKKINADSFFIQSHPEAKPGDYWIINVKDTGVGMDRQTLSRIFDPFFTTKIKSSVKGTGLGLSIVYSIIKIHGGFIKVYSDVGLGSVFSIYLPVCNNDRTKCIDVEDLNVIRGEGTILVVDDEESILDSSKIMLTECGYDVITCSNGEEAVELYKKDADKIKAVLLDTVMPVKSGIEALIELRKINCHVKVLMTSGLDSDELVKNVMDSGATGFIKKPASIEQLSAKLHSILKDK